MFNGMSTIAQTIPRRPFTSKQPIIKAVSINMQISIIIILISISVIVKLLFDRFFLMLFRVLVESR